MVGAPRPRALLWFDVAHFLVFVAGMVAFHEISRAWGWWAAIGYALALFAVLQLLTSARRRWFVVQEADPEAEGGPSDPRR